MANNKPGQQQRSWLAVLPAVLGILLGLGTLLFSLDYILNLNIF